MDLILKARLSWVELLRPNRGRRIGLPPPRDLAPDATQMVASLSKRAAGLIEKKPTTTSLRRSEGVQDQETIILALRRERRLGVKQLRNELIRQHQIVLSLDTLSIEFSSDIE